MAAPEPRGRVDALEGMRDVLNSRKSEIEAAHGQLGGKAVGQKGFTAASKMQAYRSGQRAMSHYNQTTERLLRSPSNGQTPSPADPPASSLSSTSAELSEHSRVFSVPGEKTSSMLTRVTRSNRTLSDKVKTLEEEIEKYKGAFESINTDVNDISKESRSTDQQVAILVDELQLERKNHERARHSLEQEAKKVEEQSTKLNELEIVSGEVHRENMELSRKIQELTSRADEREAEVVAAADDEASVRADADWGGDGEPGAMVAKKDFGDLKAELIAVKEKLASTSGMLEMSRKKAERFQAELSRRKTWTEFWKTVWFVWWFVTKIVGYMGFLLFAYLAFSEDNWRSEGIDVYRLAH